jgi:PAS domain S-box-containing protein
MINAAIQILEDHVDVFVDRLCARLGTEVPSYGRIAGPELRMSVDGFTRDLLHAVVTGDSERLTERMNETSATRVSQGFALSEYLRALFLAPPVCRELVREIGPRGDPTLAAGISELELRLHELTAMAANIFTETSARQLRAKNAELNRLNQALASREAALEAEGVKGKRALASANEFNARVLESLASGVTVISTKGRIVTLFTQRLEAITEIPAEEALGRPAAVALARLSGIDHALVVQSVVSTGRFPLTKLKITTPSGRVRTVFVRGQRMFDEEGEPEGTVLVVDDVSERELLIDSFSRYVSRDLVTRLLARSEPLGLEGERRTCTVLFADIRGFTRIAEETAPEELHKMLNEYLHVMVESIVEQGGFIDKFVGDKVMALFSGPRSTADSAHAAVLAARTIHARIARENATRAGAPIEVGIGINTGEMVVGNVGDQWRMDFTAIGDAVNVGDRLQSLAKGVETLVGGLTAELIRDRVALADLGEQTVKGRVGAVRVFQVRDDAPG